jgi:prevent-host-death family protein
VPHISVRELRNDVSAILRRVEAGERLTVTVNGRPVAELVPVDNRPTFRSWEWFEKAPKADASLISDLREALGRETTQDLPDRWS